jgi:hypothetical protein
MVNIGGTEYALRSLTVRQARAVHEIEDLADREIAALALATGATTEAITAWYDSAPAGHVIAAVNAMWTATNATEDAQFPGPAANDVGDERPGV